MNNLKDVGAIVEEIIEEVINPEQPVDLTWLKTEISIALLAERRGMSELIKKCKNLDEVIGSLDVKNPNAVDALLNVQLKNQEQIAKLEAEAKAVRSRTIEECAKVAFDMENEVWDDGQYRVTDSGTKIAMAIRALNSGKE